MGLRGRGARSAKEIANREFERERRELQGYRDVDPWTVPGLTRSQRVIQFCESFTITSGPDLGRFFRLRPWQRRFIEDVYREDSLGVRPVRTAILSMGRKNGKTALAALMALCHLCGPEAEPRGEAYSCANDRAQASKIFAEAEAAGPQSSHPRRATDDLVAQQNDARHDQRLDFHRAVVGVARQDAAKQPSAA
jgi:phage terminase large subunit-like protein